MRHHSSRDLTNISKVLEHETRQCGVHWRVPDINERGVSNVGYVVDAHCEIGGLHK